MKKNKSQNGHSKGENINQQTTQNSNDRTEKERSESGFEDPPLGDVEVGPDLVEVGQPETSYITLQELKEDVGAFLYFLKENLWVRRSTEEEEDNEGIPSAWMLIPKTLNVSFRAHEEDCILEKEITSRCITIVSQKVPKEEESERRKELLKYFSNVLASDQFEQVTTFLKKLEPRSRQALLETYRNYQATMGKVKM